MARPKKIKKPEQDEIREKRILMEIVVDAHDVVEGDLVFSASAWGSP